MGNDGEIEATLDEEAANQGTDLEARCVKLAAMFDLCTTHSRRLGAIVAQLDRMRLALRNAPTDALDLDRMAQYIDDAEAQGRAIMEGR